RERLQFHLRGPPFGLDICLTFNLTVNRCLHYNRTLPLCQPAKAAAAFIPGPAPEGWAEYRAAAPLPPPLPGLPVLPGAGRRTPAFRAEAAGQAFFCGQSPEGWPPRPPAPARP